MEQKPKATQEQIEVAKRYKIPFRQAHTVNLEKVRKYEEYLASQRYRDEQFLNSLGE